MIQLVIEYGSNLKEVTVYHLWDVDEADIVYVDDATPDDAGKFLLYDDGSEWLSKIISVTDATIRTELNLVRRADIVAQSKLVYPGSSYSGVLKREEHNLLRGYRPGEKRTAYRLMSGYEVKYLTTRIKMFTLEEISKKLADKGITEDYIVTKLKELAEHDGGRLKDKLDILVVLARAHGIELDKPQMVTNTKVPLLAQFNQFNIHEARRSEQMIPNKAGLVEIIDAAHKVIDEPKIFENAKNDYDKPIYETTKK